MDQISQRAPDMPQATPFHEWCERYKHKIVIRWWAKTSKTVYKYFLYL